MRMVDDGFVELVEAKIPNFSINVNHILFYIPACCLNKDRIFTLQTGHRGKPVSSFIHFIRGKC